MSGITLPPLFSCMMTKVWYYGCTMNEPTTEIDAGPEVGTYACTAKTMAQIFPDFDWDAWKDEMKEADL